MLFSMRPWGITGRGAEGGKRRGEFGGGEERRNSNGFENIYGQAREEAQFKEKREKLIFCVTLFHELNKITIFQTKRAPFRVIH